MNESNSSEARDSTLLLSRFDLTSLLVSKLTNNEAIIGGIGNTNFDLWASGHRPENFYMLGSMGLAVPIALGVALAQPERKVFALEGDGSILMQLGVLGTIAAVEPKNLTVIVMDNGSYQITGSQPTVTASVADVVSIARGSGIQQSYWADSETRFAELVDQALAVNGPSLIGARVSSEPAKATTERDPSRIRDRFMRGLGVVKS
jgi:thiamine pyrophosphate-dependent acetolactate synthase large subunit-like protein